MPFFFQSAETYQRQLLNLAREIKTPILFGSPAFRQHGTEVTLFNHAYLISSSVEVVGYYDKMHLVSFGEYVPFPRVLFFLNALVEGIGDFAAGTVPTAFSLPPGKFGVLICYEGIFPELTRRFVRRGAVSLVNITNDAWFGRTSTPAQHLMMEVMRAGENRVPLLRAANTGFSVVVDLDGRIRAQTNLYKTLCSWRKSPGRRSRLFTPPRRSLCTTVSVGSSGAVRYSRDSQEILDKKLGNGRARVGCAARK